MAKKMKAPRSKKGGKKADGSLKNHFRLPGENTVRSVARDVLACKAKGSEHNGRAGKLVRDAVNEKHFHAKALNTAMGLAKTGESKPGQLFEFLVHFDHYRKAMKLDDIATKQGAMEFMANVEGDGEGSETPGSGKAAATKLAETEAEGRA